MSNADDLLARANDMLDDGLCGDDVAATELIAALRDEVVRLRKFSQPHCVGDAHQIRWEQEQEIAALKAQLAQAESAASQAAAALIALVVAERDQPLRRAASAQSRLRGADKWGRGRCIRDALEVLGAESCPAGDPAMCSLGGCPKCCADPTCKQHHTGRGES